VIVATAALPIVDGLDLPDPHRQMLRPGQLMPTRSGAMHRLPRFFYAIESATIAASTLLTPHFGLWEFIEVDLYEPALLRAYPRYVPCAVTLLAAALEVLRTEANGTVHVAANGGYRSPAHNGSRSGSAHCWGTAANVYRVGSEFVDTEERITRYAAMASRSLMGCWTRPYGRQVGFADDHLHIDFGFVRVVPPHFSDLGEV
jgi:hypothetical protein